MTGQATVSRPSEYQRSHWHVDAARQKLLYRGFPGLFASHAIMYMDSIAFFAGAGFTMFCVGVALFWLSYRAYQVLNKPLDELAGLLGFDIPTTPGVDLAGIKADGAIIHWKPPEKARHIKEYEIYLNGKVVGTVMPAETSAVIAGLVPDTFYIIRVAVMNQLEFTSRSIPIRIRTKPAASGDFFSHASDGHETDGETIEEPVPHVRSYKALKDFTPPSPKVVPMAREHSAGLGPKRSITGRRPSPAVLGLDIPQSSPEDPHEQRESDESIQQLTEKLDGLRRECDEAERQAQEEEQEEARQKDELIRERDDLRAAAKKKDNASRELKREVNALERSNTAAQNEKNKQERLLQQKKQERQKLKDDAVRWEREAVELTAEAERIAKEKLELKAKVEKEMEALREKQAEEVARTKVLEDEIKDRNAQIKKLERAKNSSPSGEEPQQDLVRQQQREAEEDRAWQMNLATLQQQFSMAAQKVDQAKRIHDEQIQYLAAVRQERARQVEASHYASPPPTLDRAPRRGDSQRSRRTPSGPGTSHSPSLNGGFATMTQAPFGAAMNSTSPSFPTSVPYFNFKNGMTISAPGESSVMTEEDKERLTGGAPMSPGAGAELLPSGLLMGDDDLRSRDGDQESGQNENDSDRQSSLGNAQTLAGLGALPGLGMIPGLGSQPIPEYPAPGPTSPGSVSSRSPSTFASPQASTQNLHLGSPDNGIDSDRRSIRSNRSNRAASGGGSRFSQILGIRPNRGKTMSDEGPALGKAQSHSMPREDQGLAGIDSATRKRNSSISGNFFGGVLSRGDKDSTSEALPEQKQMLTRRRPFNLFGQKAEGWPASLGGLGAEIRPASPRPGSTHSTELPRPSQDSTRWGLNWGSTDASSLNRSSPLSLGNNWGLPQPQQSRIWGSRHPSRRPSVQHGASGPPEDILEDEDSDALPDEQPSVLAPIGTKPPPGSKRPVTPKLNPAAKDFTSFFSRMKPNAKDKDGAGSGKNGAATPLASSSNTPILTAELSNDDSPPNSRKSRDTRSVTTAESSLLESSRNSLDRTPSYDAPPPSSLTGKESFMQKLSRKSSSGKFSLPTFKRDKSRMGDGLSTPMQEDYPEDDPLSASASSFEGKRESREVQRGSGRSWSSVLKLGKGRKGETPSLSGVSAASETDLDEEDV